MRSNLLWSSPLRYPFLFSAVLVQSHGACVFVWAVLSHMNLFDVCPCHRLQQSALSTLLSMNGHTHKLNATQISTSSTVTAKQI